VRPLQLDDLLVLTALLSSSPESAEQFIRDRSSSWSAFKLAQRNRLDWQKTESKEDS